jgi:tellurite resistance protein TerC
MEANIYFWIGFIAFVVVMLILDLYVFHKKDEVVNVKSALWWSAFWIALALIFNVGVYFYMSHDHALDFFTAYILEKSLSVDNLFVFIMIFGFFRIQPEYQHRILFWGIIGAVVMRAIFIFAGVALIQQFAWIMYVFGAFLIYTGIHMLLEKKEKEEFDPNKNIVIRLFKKIMPVTEENDNHSFFLKKNGKTYATTFFIALLFIEASDVIFAVDSIPAVLAVTQNQFIVFTSNIFAILGLRSLYFALSGVMDYFAYLKYALAAILSFIGIKMCINELARDLDWHFHIGNFTSLGVIIGLLTVSITYSIYRKNLSLRS